MNGVQLGFPDSVSRVLKAKPKAYTTPQYVAYNSQYGNNILMGRSENSDFHSNAQKDLLLQLENKRRDAEARERRLLMGNPMPKLPMHSWQSAGRPFMMADKTVPMSNSDLRGGVNPNYTPEALEIQRKYLKRRANEVGVISRNEMPPPSMKPKKTFSDSLADVINTVILSLQDAVGSGNYSGINAGDIYKLFRSLSENGYVFETNQLIEFKEDIDDMMSDLEGVANPRVPTNEQRGAKLLLNAFGRVSNLLTDLLRISDLPVDQRRRAGTAFVSRIKKELPPIFRQAGEPLYNQFMEAVYSEMEQDRGTEIPRTFAEVGEVPMDAYREAGEETFDPYEEEEARTSSSLRADLASRDASYMRYMEAMERGELPEDMSTVPSVVPAPVLPAPPTSLKLQIRRPRGLPITSIPSVVPAPVTAPVPAPVPAPVTAPRLFRGIPLPNSAIDVPSARNKSALIEFVRRYGFASDPSSSGSNIRNYFIRKVREQYRDF
jgi:hypothetical protein